MKTRIWILMAATALTGCPTVTAQPAGMTVAQAEQLFLDGQWDTAAVALEGLLAKGSLSQDEASQARKYLGLSYSLLKQPDRAVATFKELVRTQSRFSLDDLAVEGSPPPETAIRYLGQAALEVNAERETERLAAMRQTSATGAFGRSLLLPGWGQRYRGYRGRGRMLMALAAGSAGWAIWAEVGFRDARDKYDKAGMGASFDDLYRDYKNKADRADLALGALGVMWLYNAVDAGFQGPNITARGLAVQPTRDGDGVQLVLARSF